MTETSLLTPWANFYIMTGSAAAALIGLMFVVITLVTGEERAPKNPDGIATFSTPTVLHFSSALLVSAICSAPWPSFAGPAVLVGLVGLGGVCYIVRVFYLARRLPTYEPDVEDWAFYTVLPFVAYGTLFASAIVLHFGLMGALFGYGGGITMLIFIGIHNAWDVVTYLATGGADTLKPPAP
jgi:hypothetical protein